MIDEKLLLYFIKTRSREFEEQSFTIHKECTGSLRDMEYTDVIIHSVNLNTLTNVTRILNELIEMIEEGKFNTSENSVSCFNSSFMHSKLETVLLKLMYTLSYRLKLLFSTYSTTTRN